MGDVPVTAGTITSKYRHELRAGAARYGGDAEALLRQHQADIEAAMSQRDAEIARLQAALAQAEALNRINLCAYCHAQFQRTEDGVRQLAKHILCCERNPLAVALHRVADERDAAIAAHKNMHRSLCARFGYPHDEHEWRRDQVSLEEYIARLVDLLRAECQAGRDWADDVGCEDYRDDVKGAAYDDARAATDAAGAMGENDA